MVTRTDPVAHIGGLACRGLQRVLPCPERQPVSCLQEEAAASPTAFNFFFFTLLWPLQLQPRRLFSIASKCSTAPFSLPCHEKSEAGQRQPTQARGGCRQRHPQGRNRQPRPRHGLWERERSSGDRYYRSSPLAKCPPSPGVLRTRQGPACHHHDRTWGGLGLRDGMQGRRWSWG